MAKYIDSEKLIAEIERRLERYDPNYTSAGLELKELIFFVTSLQKEQLEVDLNAEIEKELRLHYNDDQDVYWWNYLKNSFRHFYELGLNARKEK